MSETILVERDLTQQESADHADRMAALIDEIRELEKQKSESAKEYKNQIDEKVALLNDVAAQHRTGKVVESVEVDRVRDPERQVIKYIDIETREVVREDPFSEADRQLELDDEDGGDDDDDAD